MLLRLGWHPLARLPVKALLVGADAAETAAAMSVVRPAEAVGADALETTHALGVYARRKM